VFTYVDEIREKGQMHYVNNGLQGYNQAVKLAKMIMNPSNIVLECHSDPR
jgi:hypothetical protein